MAGGVTGDAVAFIRQAVTKYTSATTALIDYRAEGGRVGNDAWYRAFRDQTQGYILEQGWTARDLRRLPSPEHLGTWEAGQPGMYAYHMRIPTTNTETGLTVDHFYTYMTDTLTSPDRAMLLGVSDYQQNIDEGRYPEVLGVPEFRGVFVTV